MIGTLIRLDKTHYVYLMPDDVLMEVISSWIDGWRAFWPETQCLMVRGDRFIDLLGTATDLPIPDFLKADAIAKAKAREQA